MLTALILLQLLIPPSFPLFFGSGGCGCPCPVPPPIPICAPQPICAQPAPCSSVSSYPSYSTSYTSAPALVTSPYYHPGWSPAIPSYASAPTIPSYSTSYSMVPPPLIIPSAPSYVAPVSARSYVMTPPITIPGPLPPSPIYMPTPMPLSIPASPVTDDFDKILIESSIATTPSYLQSGYAPAATKSYAKQYDDDDSLESMNPQLPSHSLPIESLTEPSTYDYRTSEIATPNDYYKPVIAPSSNYVDDTTDESELVEKQGYWSKELPISQTASRYGQLETRHNILKRMKTETIPRTNNTCNSIKLSNVMMRAIVDDVSISKRMVQNATKNAFDGAKFDVFCAIGEFSYSIHSRKYCEVTKKDVTCFAFR